MFLKQFQNYTAEMEQLLAGDRMITGDICKYYRTQISFLQYERIAHLHVLIGVLLADLLCMTIMIISLSPGTIAIFLLFLILLIPYVIHYFRLENLIQKWYFLYNDLIKKMEA